MALNSSKYEDMTLLLEIIDRINANFGTDFTDEDILSYFADDMEIRLNRNAMQEQTFNSEINSKENILIAFNNFFEDSFVEIVSTNKEIFKKGNDDEDL